MEEFYPCCKSILFFKSKGYFKSGKVLHLSEKIPEPALGLADGMTVQEEQRIMPQTAATRSRFMITDILNGPAADGAILRGGGGRSPSPGPRDLSLHSTPLHADSDTDSSGHPDTSSICSNGMFILIYS